MFRRKTKSAEVRLPPLVRAAQEAVIDNEVLARRLCALDRHELLNWLESSLGGAAAALDLYRQQPSFEGSHSVHALCEQAFALSFELHRREQEKTSSGNAGPGGSPRPAV